MHTHRGRILIAFAIVYLVWGSTYLGIRVAVETIPPFLLAATRSLFAGAILFAFARWRNRNTAPAPQRPSASHWRTAFIMGFLMFVMGNALLSWAETRIDSGLAALIVGAIPLWVVVMARLTPYGPRREITLQKFVGVVVGIAGLGMLVWPGSASAGVRMDPLAIGLLMLGSLGWSWGTVISPQLAHTSDKLEGSAMTMLAGGAMILIPAALKGEFTQLHPELISARSIAAWAYLVVFGSMIAYSAYVYLVASCEASTVATYALVNPIVAVFLGWLFVGEVVTARMVTATFVIVAGLALTLFGGQAAVWANRQVRATGAAIRSVVL
ncbi:MAG TPA: EamA family transporter [Gemmatimonadales bacterium]|nr:EamA family transporter [Gemmatimonadales bacterium]